MAARLGGRAGLPRAEPRARRGRGRAPLVPAGDAPVPVGDAPHGARPQLHDGRRPDAPAPAERLARAAPDGLRLVRPACRECCAPRRRASAQEHRALHRPHARADEAAGLGDRLGPRGLSAPARVLPLDAVAVPEVLRARPRVSEGGAGQLVPERPDGRRERVRHRRPLRALRSRGGGAEPRAVVLQDHGLRRRAARVRPAAGRRVAGADEDDPAQLDRSLGGRGDPVPHRRAGRGRARLHDAAGHAVRRDVLRAGAGASARRAHRRARRFRRTRSRPPPAAARSGPPRR